MTKPGPILAATLILIALSWWALVGVHQADYYRAENANRDTLLALAAFEDSAKAAFSELNTAMWGFSERYHRGYPQSAADYVLGGAELARVVRDTNPNNPYFWYWTSVGLPVVLGASDSIKVGVMPSYDTKPSYAALPPDYTAEIRVGQRLYSCSESQVDSLECGFDR